ncbi:PIN domain-containing protein [Leptospira selangorensis]|uniref:PIN domain-containing protein n=1 Tax=Leptospira selangorensis TaxID=2484982 RepID=A0A5F2C6H3_9LEPT|nr:PIN domain-containing protein [Leptospira selangorensis]TGM10288.1 PIN domain-containing protein [Leptospira selangorensis]TGM27950.1 PIN domain-containing protein [Leptospira selangorensis]
MILVDTSVWIEFFRGNEPYFSELKELIESSEVIVHEVVFGELLQGCKNKNEVSFILEYWENLNTLTSDGSFLLAGKLSFESKHIDKGIGLIDSVLINEVRSKKLRLWTLDKKILKVLDKKEIYSS